MHSEHAQPFSSTLGLWKLQKRKSSEELIEAYDIFSEFKVRGDQRGGIYDGPEYGRKLFDEYTGEGLDIETWIQDDTCKQFCIGLLFYGIGIANISHDINIHHNVFSGIRDDKEK